MATPCTSPEAPTQESLSTGASNQPQHQPNVDRVRRRLEAVLAEMRGERKMAWDFPVQLVYQKIFPDMTHFLPEDEGARYRADFEKEWLRLATA
jgi:hypothetical protein